MDTSIKTYEFKGLGKEWQFEAVNEYDAFLQLCGQVVGSVEDENGCLDHGATIEKYQRHCEEVGSEIGNESDMILVNSNPYDQ